MSWLYTLVFVGMMFSNNVDTHHVAGISTPNEPIPAVQPTPLAETERIEKSFPLTANGRVCVSNVNGSINVVAWDQNEVKLVAVKSADTKERLADVDIKIDARPDYISVESDYGDDNWKRNSDRRWRDNDKVVVEYELSVPRGAVLNEIETVNGSATVANFTNVVKVSAVNGTVRATNIRGTADLSTVNGEVYADFDRLASGSRIALETVNGRVNLLIPSDSNATLKAESLNGPITNDFGLPSRKGKYVGNSLHGRLGSGEVAISLESVNGSLTVKRKSDGKPLSPATNLLPAKDEDDDGDVDVDPVDVAKLNREVDRSVREAQRKAREDAQRELDRIKVDAPRIKIDALKNIDKSIDTKDIEKSIKDGLEAQRIALTGMRDAMFYSGIPRVESKTNSFPVKGAPKVTIDAKGCSVRVRGWDNPEVKYSLVQLRGGTSKTSPAVSESKTDSSVTLKVAESSMSDVDSALGNSPANRIEVFVPRKSNVKIISDKEVRLEGVSGELEIVGGDESVDVRDSDGKLKLTNADGRVRVIGFNGEITAQTGDGEIYIEGTISKLSASAGAGTVFVTLPADASVDVSSTNEPETEGFTLAERDSKSWRLGNGGANISFNSEDGKLVLRNASLLSK
jgi:DUF4097 and DUF4098 domain-containing protein YvlB